MRTGEEKTGENEAQCAVKRVETKITKYFLKSVLETSHDDESAHARLQFITVLMVINAFNARHEVLTTPKLCETLNLDQRIMSRMLLALVKRGLIDREQIKNSIGRGHVHALRVKETPELSALHAEMRESFSGGLVADS